YNWSSGGTSQTATGLTAGTATVTVTDNGCAVVDTFVVSEPAQILVDKSNSINPTLCGANNGRAVLNVSGGVQPYQFLWDNGKNTNAIISLKAGTYFVTITDYLGCIFTDSVIISEPNAPSLSTNGSTVICGDDSTGTASVNVTGGT